VRWLEQLIVRRFFQLTLVLALVLVTAGALALAKKVVTLGDLAKATDSLLKALAILVGALWSLNRYFTMRTDYPQLRVEMVLDALPSKLVDKEDLVGLVFYRLDIINTGKALLPVTRYSVKISNVALVDEKVLCEPLHEWGTSFADLGYPIEPGSWGAISEAFACPKDVLAVQVFLDVELERNIHWTWHRVMSVPQGLSQAMMPALDAREPARS
jgi:hypothetical protein